MSSLKFLSVLAMAALVLGNPAWAAEPTTDDVVKRMNKAVDGYVFESALRLLSPQDSLRLVMVARQAAAARSCEGYAIDGEKFGKVMNDIVAALAALTKEGENNLPVDVVNAAYSVSFGGQLAIAAYDTNAYCTEMAKLRESLKDDAEGRVSVWKPGD